MNLSTIRDIRTFCQGLDSEPNWREVIKALLDEQTDFEINNVRFIADNDILKVMADELTSDLYVLGSFNASFIAEQCNWPKALVVAAQNGDAYEALGTAIADNTDMEAFAKAYASADGYGHHFNHYDGNEEEVTLNGVEFHVFDNRC